MWLRVLAQVAGGIGRLVYPNSCLVCDAPEAEGPAFRHGLCGQCVAAVTADAAGVCPRCAATLGPHSDLSDGCPACRGQAFGFSRAVRLGPYADRLREAILRMKSWPGEAVAEMLGRLFLEAKGAGLCDLAGSVLVPVPLHWRRRWVRGYNQAAAVGRELAAGLGLAFEPAWLRRVKDTPQHGQPSATARRENVRSAFRCSARARPEGKTVLLVDDVMTTGSTLSEAARTLRGAGAADVVAAVLARR